MYQYTNSLKKIGWTASYIHVDACLLQIENLKSRSKHHPKCMYWEPFA